MVQGPQRLLLLLLLQLLLLLLLQDAVALAGWGVVQRGVPSPGGMETWLLLSLLQLLLATVMPPGDWKKMWMRFLE